MRRRSNDQRQVVPAVIPVASRSRAHVHEAMEPTGESARDGVDGARAYGSHFFDFGQLPLHPPSAPMQRGLTLSEPGDSSEQDADRIANEVTDVPLAGTGSVSGSGQSLPTPVRADFEQRLGWDFSRVRIHTDRRAAESARYLNARAYTYGRDVVFGAGQFQPGTAAGARLLAHELVHVGQQAANPGAPLVQRQPLPGAGPIISPTLARMLGYLTLDGFALNGPTPTPQHRGQLDAHAATLRNLLSAYPSGLISITGHTDATGTEQHNEELGQQRADAVKQALSDRGIEPAAMLTRSAGESELRVRTGRAEAHNRRVVIEFRPTLPAGLSGPQLQLPQPAAPPPAPNLELRPDFALPTRPPYLPPSRPPPAAPSPGRPSVQVSPGGLFWLDIVVNPPGPVPPEARVAQVFREHGIPLSDAQLRALMDGRAEGMQQLEQTVRTLAPSLDAATRSRLVQSIADALMSANLRSQLEREHPTAIEEAQQRERRFEDLVAPGSRGPSVEGGVRLRIHF